mgnify:CR=1 FL=1|tara:strand:+ start:1253 stop:1777 length:525 start_codon:yes stop_codon:yes gene_type:complete
MKIKQVNSKRIVVTEIFDADIGNGAGFADRYAWNAIHALFADNVAGYGMISNHLNAWEVQVSECNTQVVFTMENFEPRYPSQLDFALGGEYDIKRVHKMLVKKYRGAEYTVSAPLKRLDKDIAQFEALAARGIVPTYLEEMKTNREIVANPSSKFTRYDYYKFDYDLSVWEVEI